MWFLDFLERKWGSITNDALLAFSLLLVGGFIAWWARGYFERNQRADLEGQKRVLEERLRSAAVKKGVLEMRLRLAYDRNKALREDLAKAESRASELLDLIYKRMTPEVVILTVKATQNAISSAQRANTEMQHALRFDDADMVHSPKVTITAPSNSAS